MKCVNSKTIPNSQMLISYNMHRGISVSTPVHFAKDFLTIDFPQPRLAKFNKCMYRTTNGMPLCSVLY